MQKPKLSDRQCENSISPQFAVGGGGGGVGGGGERGCGLGIPNLDLVNTNAYANCG